MSSEVAKSVKILEVINIHLQEIECCHGIKCIMREALQIESKLAPEHVSKALEPTRQRATSVGQNKNGKEVIS